MSASDLFPHKNSCKLSSNALQNLLALALGSVKTQHFSPRFWVFHRLARTQAVSAFTEGQIVCLGARRRSGNIGDAGIL